MSSRNRPNRRQTMVQGTAVFLGPTLPWEDARRLLRADYYPPARKGDIYRILPTGVQTIILVDGVFHSTPSVWQRELLDAMHEGVQVLGASSMGALRAAELNGLGMVGYGTVFAWYRDGVIDGDDEVALLHASEEFGFRPLSESLVNIRYTLLRAVKDQCLVAREAERLMDYAKQLYYPDRSYRRLLESPVAKRWSAQRRAGLEEYFRHKKVDIKRRDAIGVLRHASRVRRAARLDPCDRAVQGSTRPVHQHDRLVLTGFFGAHGAVDGARILAEARKDRALVQGMWLRLSRRFFVLEWALQGRINYPAGHRQYARSTSTFGRPPHKNWLQANGLTHSAWLKSVQAKGLCDWLTRLGPARFGLLWSSAQACREETLLTGMSSSVGDRAAESVQRRELWEELSQRRFVLEWANRNGVRCPAPRLSRCVKQWTRTVGRGRPPSASIRDRLAERALVDWVIEQGPAYFGHDWRFEVALMQELQITGKSAELAAKVREL